MENKIEDIAVDCIVKRICVKVGDRRRRGYGELIASRQVGEQAIS